MLVYHLDSRTFERLTDFGSLPRWLPDSRRLVFNSEEGELFLVDSRTLAWHRLLSAGGARLSSAEVSRDGRWLYFVRVEADSDIWLATFVRAQANDERR